VFGRQSNAAYALPAFKHCKVAKADVSELEHLTAARAFPIDNAAERFVVRTARLLRCAMKRCDKINEAPQERPAAGRH
jgi:hypothetical protein